MVYRVFLKLFRTTNLSIDLKNYDTDSNGFIVGDAVSGEYLIIKDWIMVCEVKPAENH